MNESCPVTTSRDGERFYIWGDTVVPTSTADQYAAHKRLGDAEVAADYWGLRAMLDGGLVTSHDVTIPWRNDGCQPIRESMTEAGKKIRKQVDTLLRFAMQPSAHESDYR